MRAPSRLQRGALLAVIAAIGALGAIGWNELRTSRLQAWYFSHVAEDMRYGLEPGPSPTIRFPQTGPYDRRLGYVELPELVRRLDAYGFGIDAQARQTPQLAQLVESGYSPPYREKTRAGLSVLDCRGTTLYATTFPRRGYPSFESIPPLVTATLLFIENRTLLDASQPRRNPAVEWPRLAQAVVAQALQLVAPGRDAPGGSTLATQMEKYRHSAAGITASAREKFRQMYSASLRAYAAGRDTSAARRGIVLDYLNTLPLAAAPGFGEVSGLPDGLSAWYGASPSRVDAALRQAPNDPQYDLEAQARAYRVVLSLLIAQRRPTDLLGPGRAHLRRLTDSYLRLLANAGIIGPALRDAALGIRLEVTRTAPARPAHANAPKAAYAVRSGLVELLGKSQFYDLDRLDLSVASTFDAGLQASVTHTLERLRAPARAAAEGLDARPLLGTADPSHVIYSFTLYERGAGANLVRVQTDTTGQPFDMNSGARLELGSTAKLRTLASYLDIVAALHARLAPLDDEALRRVDTDRRDRLTRWAIDHLSRARGTGLERMLEAALERRYSASPAERFFTAGGTHRFSNFGSRNDGRTPTLREAFRESINLPFVRLMRDIVDHHIFGIPGAAAVIDDPEHPDRAAYLARFADFEGKVFLRRFHERYADMDPAQALDALGRRARGIPARLAVVFRSVAPRAGLEAFTTFLNRYRPERTMAERSIAELYEAYRIERYSLHDRGYISQIHPLELWLVGYLAQHPGATYAEAVAASAAERQHVYAWLYKRSKHAQDRRIRPLMEIDAFEAIHAQWARLGYPFDDLVPSYATAIGVSGDNPAALADLIGIIVNGGMRLPTVRIEALHFARATPYETLLKRDGAKGERVLHEAVAAALKAALAEVVEDGTARRVRDTYLDADGLPLAIGGKTGTGDNRHDVFGKGGALVESQSVSRTATFAFFIGDRHFGVVTAYVPGPRARNYHFTSALPVQIVKDLAPQLRPYLNAGANDGCSDATVADAAATERTAD